jgi:transcriptional adapter 3
LVIVEIVQFDLSNRDDDEITSALRQCQRLLLHQTALNEQRRARLADIATRRLAYSEYQTALDGVEKDIQADWARRVKKYGLGPKRSSQTGSGPGATGRPPMPETLKKRVQIRNNWLQTVGQCMRERPRGEVMGLPTGSIYEGIGDDEERDEKTVEDVVEVDEMDVDDVEGGMS